MRRRSTSGGDLLGSSALAELDRWRLRPKYVLLFWFFSFSLTHRRCRITTAIDAMTAKWVVDIVRGIELHNALEEGEDLLICMQELRFSTK